MLDAEFAKQLLVVAAGVLEFARRRDDADAGALAAAEFDDSVISHIDYPGWFKETFYDLDEDIAEGRDDGKQGLMILFTTEGCSYCARFIDVSLGNPELAARVQKDFVAVGMEIFDDKMMTSPEGESMPISSPP